MDNGNRERRIDELLLLIIEAFCFFVHFSIPCFHVPPCPQIVHFSCDEASIPQNVFVLVCLWAGYQLREMLEKRRPNIVEIAQLYDIFFAPSRN